MVIISKKHKKHKERKITKTANSNRIDEDKENTNSVNENDWIEIDKKQKTKRERNNAMAVCK